MITTEVPADWRSLQDEVGRILVEGGFSVEIEKTIQTVRGQVEVDVVAEESVAGRQYTIFCECKHWKKNVPQNVIHGFRTVVADAGANIGYIVSSGGFQSGVFTAAELTNIRLVTWEQFQLEFEKSWIDNYLLSEVRRRLDPLLSYVEPLLPRAFQDLSDEEQQHFIDLKHKYDEFGWLMMKFTPYAAWTTRDHPPKLPIREHFKIHREGTIPDEVLDAVAYRDFLEIAAMYGEQAISDFRRALKKE